MKKIKVVIAGLPGKMASLVAKYVERAKDMKLMGFALSEIEQQLQIGKTAVFCVPFQFDLKKVKREIEEVSPDVIVDFTLPKSVNWDADLYCECGIPFVMGTTGGDRELLQKTVEKSNISAVIAPNMAKQIVAFQSMVRYAAENFPDVFKGYSLKIIESHQKSKADTSGTAKKMVQYFNQLGVPFKKEQIVKVREPQKQLEMKIPEKYLTGHGWHTYTLESADGTVLFRLTHNVNGRDTYAQGTLDAIRFLAKRGEIRGKVFSMTDVLEAYD